MNPDLVQIGHTEISDTVYLEYSRALTLDDPDNVDFNKYIDFEEGLITFRFACGERMKLLYHGLECKANEILKMSIKTGGSEPTASPSSSTIDVSSVRDVSDTNTTNAPLIAPLSLLDVNVPGYALYAVVCASAGTVFIGFLAFLWTRDMIPRIIGSWVRGCC